MQAFSRFERFENEVRPVESFLGHLEDKPSVELANALRPLIVEEGVEPEEIELRVVDAEGSRYVFRPRPDWMGLILKI